MTPLQLVFLLVAAVTLISAVMVVSARRIMHAALWLILTLFGVAVLFAMLEAGFFAVVQVVVYIGAISILVIFAVMLTRQVMQDTGPQVNRWWWVSALAAAGLYAGLIGLISAWRHFDAQAVALPAGSGDIASFGLALVSPTAYVIPFEVASLLLLAALIGSIFVAAERKGER